MKQALKPMRTLAQQQWEQGQSRAIRKLSDFLINSNGVIYQSPTYECFTWEIVGI